MTIISSFFDRIARFFRETDRSGREKIQKDTDRMSDPLPKLGDATRVRTLLAHFPDFRARIERRFGVRMTARDEVSTLSAFAKRHGLPSPSVIYMALQLDRRFENARGIDAEEVRGWLAERPEAIVLDCRESWELASPGLSGARSLDEPTLESLKAATPRSVPVLIYCHHGLRSADVAAHLVDLGFENVRWMVGGLDRFAATVDRTVPRYEAPPC